MERTEDEEKKYQTTKTTGSRRRMGRVAKSMEGILKMKRRMRIKSRFVL